MTDVATGVLAIDLGKTGCRARLSVRGVVTEAEGAGAPGLASARGGGLALAAILQVALPLVRAAGLSRVDAVGIGAAGALADPAAAQALAHHLCTALPAHHVAVASDAVTAHLGALGGAPGIVLAIGTGAVAISVEASGEMRRSDGWGPWLGDEGGGAWLGLSGLRAVLRSLDGRGPSTALTPRAEARFGGPGALAAAMESSANPARLAASFAGDVAATAAAGDAVAAGLLAEAGGALARLVRSLLPPGTPGVRLAVCGGLADPQAGLVQPLLAELAGSVSPVSAPGTSLDGAHRLAMDRETLHEPGVCRVIGADAVPHGLDLLATEGRRPGLEDLDLRPAGDVVRLVLAAERDAQDALSRAADQLAAAAEAIAARMRAGGRLFTLGAGTPGRLAMLDAAELGPTYSAPSGLVVALLAGGPGAMIEAVEGAEDDRRAAADALRQHRLLAGDAVVGIAASGRTPFVVGGLDHARACGALTVAIVNNPGSPAAAAADIAVEILTGAEIVAGSTRMTAGTTQKIALNALSTAAMVSLGKTYGAWMVDVRATNDKLRRRALRIVQEITGADPDAAAAALAAGGDSVKQAVVALLAGVDAAEAARRLSRSGGRVRSAVDPSL